MADYRVIYEFNVQWNELFLITLGHRREVYVWLGDMEVDAQLSVYNNLFYGGTFYYRAAGKSPDQRAYDNFFDRTTITRFNRLVAYH